MSSPFTVDSKLMADDAVNAYRRAGYQAWVQDFQYTIPFTNLPGAIAVSPLSRQVIQFHVDSIFCWLGTFLVADDRIVPFNVTLIRQVFVSIEDLKSRYYFHDRTQIPAAAIAGTAQAPHLLPFYHLFEPGGLCAVTLQRRQTTVPGDAQLALWGIKIFTNPFTRELRYADP